MYIRSLRLAKLRCFKKADLSFQYPGRIAKAGEAPVPTLPNVNLLLGNNGAGKSTILQGIALALISPVVQHTGYRSQSMVRSTFGARPGRPPEQSIIQAEVTVTPADVKLTKEELKMTPRPKNGKPGDYSLELGISRVRDTEILNKLPTGKPPWTRMFEEKTPGFLVLGYGANRWVAPRHVNVLSQFKENHIRYQRIRSLFEDGVSLFPLSQWIPDYSNKGRRNQVVTILHDLLSPHGYSFEGECENGELIFQQGKARVPYPALSHGFRAFIGWIGDLLYHVCEWCPSGAMLRDIEGVVIVDEVDLYLHPEWQRTVIESLARLFENVQFIFSSHSPLVTGSMEWSNIWVMSAQGPRQLADEPIHGLSADQVLLSPYFGLSTTRADSKMRELHDLNARAIRGDAQAAAEFLQKLSTGTEAPQATSTATAPAYIPAQIDSWDSVMSKLPPPMVPRSSPAKKAGQHGKRRAK